MPVGRTSLRSLLDTVHAELHELVVIQKEGLHTVSEKELKERIEQLHTNCNLLNKYFHQQSVGQEQANPELKKLRTKINEIHHNPALMQFLGHYQAEFTKILDRVELTVKSLESESRKVTKTNMEKLS